MLMSIEPPRIQIIHSKRIKYKFKQTSNWVISLLKSQFMQKYHLKNEKIKH